MGDCFFSPCDAIKAGKPLVTVGPDRVRSIIRSSKARQDGIHEELEQITGRRIYRAQMP